MGGPKLTVRVEGRPLLQYVLDRVVDAPVDEIVVILGQDANPLKGVIGLGRAKAVLNPDYREGISTSIRAGILAADPSAAAYLMLLGDQPFVAPTTLDALVRAWRQGSARLVIPTFRGRRGNPVLVDRELAREVDALTGDQGFRALFPSHAHDIQEVPVDDPGVLFDIDTPEQLAVLIAKLEEGLPPDDAVREIVTATRSPHA